MGETRRARAAEVINTQRAEFQAHDLEIGFSYPEGALVPDNSAAPPRDALGGIYFPTTKPGHRLPHAWLDKGGEQFSTHDLTEDCRYFTLLVGERGDNWVSAVTVVAEKFGIRVKAAQIGPGCEYTNPDGTWPQLRQVDDTGAILVRPDNHVAWRSVADVTDPVDELSRAFAAILTR
jgi:2,4-dichlorophenol 6-monooxygenase